MFRNIKSKKIIFFKKNIDKCIFIDNKLINDRHTLLFIMLCSNHIINLKIKYYMIYIIFKLVHYIIINGSDIIDESFIKITINKMSELKNELIIKKKIPKYFKTKLFKLFDNILLLYPKP